MQEVPGVLQALRHVRAQSLRQERCHDGADHGDATQDEVRQYRVGVRLWDVTRDKSDRQTRVSKLYRKTIIFFLLSFENNSLDVLDKTLKHIKKKYAVGNITDDQTCARIPTNFFFDSRS